MDRTSKFLYEIVTMFSFCSRQPTRVWIL